MTFSEKIKESEKIFKNTKEKIKDKKNYFIASTILLFNEDDCGKRIGFPNIIFYPYVSFLLMAIVITPLFGLQEQIFNEADFFMLFFMFLLGGILCTFAISFSIFHLFDLGNKFLNKNFSEEERLIMANYGFDKVNDKKENLLAFTLKSNNISDKDFYDIILFVKKHKDELDSFYIFKLVNEELKKKYIKGEISEEWLRGYNNHFIKELDIDKDEVIKELVVI
tara:strand:+ start:531 stop:1199 length:669 start_codon:yes stop_codon:yes gene_type:complete